MRIFFYLSYALRNLWRSRRWSAFAVFSVAAGVATMVALRSLGLSIGDSLTSDVRATNKGDITISAEGGRMFSALTDPDDNSGNMRENTLRRLDTWAAERGGRLTGYRFTAGSQLTRLDAQTVGRPQFINAYYIDPSQYPLTDDVYADEPSGVPLGELFTGVGNEVVVSRNLADRENIRVGDSVRVSSTEQEFVVRGIVPTSAQAGLYQLFGREALSLFFGFAYFDRAKVQGILDVNLGVNRVSVIFPDGTPLEQVGDYRYELYDLLANTGSHNYRISTTQDLLRAFQFISDALGRFIVTLGLGAMLLGGVGIINTMLVLVRRRTEEIAALKTFGVKGRQVALMFLAEALWIGLFGSLIGGVVGVLLSVVANRFGADLIQQPLSFRFYPEAVLFGAALGVVVSAVFGILPVLSAAKVRPAVILRPNENAPLAAGCLPRLLAIGFVVFVLGWIAGEILPVPLEFFFDIQLPYQTFGIIAVALTLLLLFLLACLMWALVWLIGKIPSFGSVDVQLALRNLTTRRMRTAITLLALSAGMFALSSIAFFGESAREILQFTLSSTLGGNVLILPVLPNELARPLIDARLNTLNGVQSRTRVMNYDAYISAVNGAAPAVNTQNNSFDTGMPLFVHDTDSADWRIETRLGRPMTQADRGTLVAVLQDAQFQLEETLPLNVGDTVTLNMYGRTAPITVEIIGIAPASLSTALGGLWIAPDVLPPRVANFTLTLAQVAPEHLNAALVGLSSLPLVLTFDVSFFDGILTRLITQFGAIPVLVGSLSLGAAAVITANTVALATLERRRQMGVLRAIGLKSNRVLRVLLLENVIVSLLGALIGIGLSGVGVLVLTSLSLDTGFLIPDSALPTAIGLVLLSVGIAVFATLASGSVAVRERVMNTLRYE